MQNKIPIAVREGYFEAGLHIEPGTPPWIFLRCSGGAQVKSRPIRYSGDCEIFFTTHMPAPIDVLQHALLIDAKDVSDLARVQNKNLAGLYEADRRLCHRRSQAGQYNQSQTPAPCCELKRRFHKEISISSREAIGTPSRSSTRRVHCFRSCGCSMSLSLRAIASARASGL